jgi:hypothetical protein
MARTDLADRLYEQDRSGLRDDLAAVGPDVYTRVGPDGRSTLANQPSSLRQVEGTGRPVHVGFIDDDGNEVDKSSVALIPTAACPSRK